MKMASIRQYFGPSLARRVFLAIMISNAIVVLFIFGKAIIDYQNIDLRPGMLWAGRGSYRLNELTTEPEAQTFGAAWTKGFHCPMQCYTQVWAHDGKLIYSDRKWADRSQLIGVHGKATRIIIDGENYNLFRHDGSRWSLRMAWRVRSTPYVMLVIATQQQQYLPILTSFLFLILPLWFAVRRGLLPLQSLAKHLGRREERDLTPLNFTTPYRELKPLVAALDGLLLQLRGKVQREYAFLQDATHELRTPIAVISAQAHILAKAATAPAQQAAKQQIEHALARATHLIAQLSELARVDAQAPQESQVLDVVQLVKLDLMQMDQAAKARQMAVLLDAPVALLHPLEANTFQSILHNLVSNAIRYGRVGGMIAVTLKQEGRSLRLSVADDGPGISLDQREQVFERFYRGIGHEVSGSGLGLAIVRQAAARLNAKVELGAGLQGQGCCFSVLIPAPTEKSGAMQ